jgi:hypothetical protein
VQIPPPRQSQTTVNAMITKSTTVAAIASAIAV